MVAENNEKHFLNELDKLLQEAEKNHAQVAQHDGYSQGQKDLVNKIKEIIPKEDGDCDCK